MLQLLKRFIRANRGVALIEFAIVFPFMLFLILGVIEVTRYILIVQKVEKAAYAMTNIVAQIPAATDSTPPKTAEISVTTMGQVFPSYDRMMAPYNSLDKEAVIFTSLVHRQQGNQNLIRWQMGGAGYGGGTLGGVNSIVNGAGPATPPTTRPTGAPCDIASFADADINAQLVSMADGENFVVGEVFFHYQSIITELSGLSGMGTGGFSIADQNISRRFFMHPRNGDLIDLPPGVPVTADPSTDTCP